MHSQSKLTDKEYEEVKAKLYNASEGELNEDGYDCRICRNKGFVATVEYQDYCKCYNTIHVPCKCQKTHAALNRLAKSGLKDVVKRYSFDSYEATEEWQKQMKDTALAYIKDNNDKWLLMSGQVGSGKSHLCTAVAVQYIRDGHDVKYMSWITDTNILKAKMKDHQEYNKMIEGYMTADVLYIDDLYKAGKDDNGNVKAPTAADIKIAFEILNYRYNNVGMTTIISSERTLQELCDIDEAVGSRIAEKAKGYCVTIKRDNARNYRLRGIKEI